MRKIARRIRFRPSARQVAASQRIAVEAIYRQGWEDRDARRTARHVPAPRAGQPSPVPAPVA